MSTHGGMYEYDCHGCGVVTTVGPAGGELDCTCTDPDQGVRARALHVTHVLEDGTRNPMGTMADLTGIAA